MGIGGTAVLDLMANTARFTANMEAAAKKLNSSTAQMNRSLMGLQTGFTQLQNIAGTAIGVIAGSAVVGIGTHLVKSFSEAEMASKSLSSALQSSGRFSEQAMNRLSESALKLSRATLAEDDAILKATATFAQFAKHLNTEELAKAQKAIVGLSQAMGIDLDKAAIQLGKAVSGATDSLGKTGIKLKETTDESERLNDALGKTAIFFAGAEAAGTTLQGRAVQLHNEFHNVQETLGGVIANGLDLNNALGPEGLTGIVINLDDWLQKNHKTLEGTIRFFAQMGETVVQMGQLISSEIMADVNTVSAGIASIVGLAIQGIENNVNSAIQGLNTLISWANMVPGVKIGQAAQFRAPGHDLFDSIKDMSLFDAGVAHQNMLSAKNSLLSGSSIFNGGGVKFGGAPQPTLPDLGIGGGSKAKNQSIPFNFESLAATNDITMQELYNKALGTRPNPGPANTLIKDFSDLRRQIDNLDKLIKKVKEGPEAFAKFTEEIDIQEKVITKLANSDDELRARYTSLLKEETDKAHAKTFEKSMANTDEQIQATKDLIAAQQKGDVQYDNTKMQIDAVIEARQILGDTSQDNIQTLAHEIIMYKQLDKSLQQLQITQKQELELQNDRRLLAAHAQGFTLNPKTHEFELKAYNDMIQLIQRENEVKAAGIALDTAEGQDMLKRLALIDQTNNAMDEMATRQSQILDMSKQIGESFTNAFESAVFGAQSFGDAMKAMLMELAHIVFENTVGKLLSTGIASLVNGLFPSGGGVAVPNFGFEGNRILTEPGGSGFGFSGNRINTEPRALGGPVSPMKPYLVGERGPEIMVPGSAGRIVPNGALGGQQSVVNHIYINALDAKSVADLFKQHAGLIGGMGLAAVQKQSNRRGFAGPLG